ncbi:MAG: DUF3604 domain-containing protein [Gammaproteobacteria bacterium]|nr:DUF3604 domain-containing protein [Gammaproteobacteria bacterium]NIV49728.1 DUF3604 domain-containing protein [Gammaproteobacteria bacterium]NIW57126.1 DUF3604 domain-containing protein [Gammaproteobacteria bacterium]
MPPAWPLYGPARTLGKPSIYCVRVLEISTPHWTAYDQKRFAIEMPDSVTMTVQDRADTSPIWYLPES